MSLNNGHITTADLIIKLRSIMTPSGEDLMILSRRNDDKFSQKVRNLHAHNTFERYEYAKYIGPAKKGYIEITAKGQEHLAKYSDVLKYLLNNDFAYDDLTLNLQIIEKKKEKIKTFDGNVVIQEGLKKITEGTTYKRSKRLRDYAIASFMKEGNLECNCCSFIFTSFYGKAIGQGFIEIHHIRPVFQYASDSILKTIKNAMSNLMPVCSNCHRMIHRNWTKPLEIQTLIDAINSNGCYKH